MLQCYRKRLRRKTPSISRPEGIGGPEICSPTAAGRREYERRIQEAAARQKHLCALCFKYLVFPQLDHQDGRGHGGGHRDDRILDEQGNWMNAALCGDCNIWKASRRFKWIEGKYQEVVRQKFKEIA